MTPKSIGTEVLLALFVMSRNLNGGVNYLDFVNQRIMIGALDLLNEGYAEKIFVGEDDSNYRLTDKGKQYLDDILRYARSHFD